MDSLFDSIVPLLIILFYLFGNFFKKKEKKEDAPSPGEPAYPQPDDQPASLREEIRRRFEERARQEQGEIENELNAELSLELEPSLLHETQSTKPLETVLNAQQKKLDDLQRKAADIKNQAYRKPWGPQGEEGPTFSATTEIKQRLRSPKALGEAVLLMEVLGKPVGLRKPDEDMRSNSGS